jgi:hypothetical protein
MVDPDCAAAAGTIEECVDALGEFIATLDRYPDIVVAHALQVHLAALLRALVACGQCTPAQAREFITDLRDEAL